MNDVLAAQPFKTNAELIDACQDLGYLRPSWLVLDPTYGEGTFWNAWRPDRLIAHDLKIDNVDFCALPHPGDHFDAVVFDAPYKLNGTPSKADERYGVDIRATTAERHDLIRRGMTECARVLKPAGFLLLKCMDQVASGKVQWQTLEFSTYGVDVLDLTLEDSLLMLTNPRKQPAGRKQVHARRNYSTMLVFRKSQSRH